MAKRQSWTHEQRHHARMQGYLNLEHLNHALDGQRYARGVSPQPVAWRYEIRKVWYFKNERRERVVDIALTLHQAVLMVRFHELMNRGRGVEIRVELHQDDYDRRISYPVRNHPFGATRLSWF